MQLKGLSTCAYALKCFPAIGEKKNEHTGDLPATAVSCKTGKYYLSLAWMAFPWGGTAGSLLTQPDVTQRHTSQKHSVPRKRRKKKKKHKLLCEHNGPEHNSNTTDKCPGRLYIHIHTLEQTLEMCVMLHLTKAKTFTRGFQAFEKKAF